MIRILSIGLMTLGALAFAKVAKAQIADVKGQEPLTNLEGTEWGPENGIGQFVQFLSNGDLAGWAGCNSFFGTPRNSPRLRSQPHRNEYPRRE